VHPALLAGRVAVDVGKQPGHHPVPQEGINALLVSLARQGKRVVRLKGGDPFLFGRGGEEAGALAAAGVAFEVVPAPTSALAALAAAGIPATDRRGGSSIAVVTGHRADGQAVDWDRLAAATDTLVVLMGLARLGEIVDRLMAGGRDPATPAAVVSRGTLPDQRTVAAPLARIAEAAAAADLPGPALLVVGEVVRLSDRLDWSGISQPSDRSR
jgi:uroporphyrin-III C-methyltransferase